MRRVRCSRLEGAQATAAALMMVAFMWGCGSDPTNPGGGDDPDPTTNRAPVASAGPDLAVSVGLPVALDGSGSSDPDGDAVTYAWSLTPPSGSAATLTGATTATPGFTPDVEGAYTLSLTVSDGEVESAADAATVTATDNTAAGTIVAATGGALTSSDGALSLTVPAGALASDTEIRVTRVADVQVPSVIADLPGEEVAYDLAPDGTTFSTPVEVAFEIDGAVTRTSGSAAIAASFLVSESGGTLEAMSDVVLAQAETDPTGATLTGGLSHFSHAVFTSPSLTFTIDAPDGARVGEPFDVTFTLDLTGLTDPTATGFTTFLENRSEGPVTPEAGGVFRQDFPTDATVSVIVNRYECSETGDGEVRVNLEFASPPLVALIQLAKEVTCSDPPPPLVTTLVPDLYRAQRLLPVPGSPEEITTGGLVRRVNVATGAVTELSDATSSYPEWVFALTDGSYLVYPVTGYNPYRFAPGGDPETTFVTPFDQPRHMATVGENTVALASAYGDLGFITYTPGGASGSFQDAFRDLASQTNPQQTTPLTNLQAIWVSPDAQTFIGAVTEGDGDSAFNDTQIALIDADVETGQLSVTVLPGIIDFIIDADVRHQFDLDCSELEGGLPSELLCVFTSGFEFPTSSLADVERDGYVAIFTVDTFDGSSELVYWDYGNARVGAGVFPFDGSTTGVAVANQLTGDIDVWHVAGSDSSVSAAFSVSLGDQCEEPLDLLLLGFGARGALACQGPTAPTHSLLLIENLDLQVPPVS